MKRAVSLLGLSASLLAAAPPPVPLGTDAAAEAVFRERHSALIAEQTLSPRFYVPSERSRGRYRPLAQSRAENRTIAAEAIKQVEAYARATNTEALLIARRGRLEHAYYKGVAANTPLVSRSMHKMIVALLIGRAIRDGHIRGLDQSVADFIPEWRGTPKAAITIEHLLRMESGLDWYVQATDPQSLYQRAYLDPYSERWIIERWPLAIQPGTAYDYSNINSELLGLIVQRATGRRYADYLSRALLRPAGAPDAQVWVNRPGGAPKSGCCLLMPAEGYLRIGMWLIDQQRQRGTSRLPRGWFADYLAPSRFKPQFGLGVWLGKPWTELRRFGREALPQPGIYHSEPYLADDLYLFDGADARLMYVIPSLDLVIVRMGGPPAPGGPRWDNAYIPNTIIRGLQELKR